MNNSQNNIINTYFKETPIDLDINKVSNKYKDEVILITGAAGSIGSEIARLLSKHTYKKIVLLDISESGIYNLQQELLLLGASNFEVVICDITDTDGLTFYFNKYKPTYIFHSAAYKHVPLMQDFPFEAVKVNLWGTKYLADLALKCNVKQFVFISTDKAVNPINIMGATKFIAELYLKQLMYNNENKTQFISTRFGNVIESNGSVIPLFRYQIKSGGPVTITDKNASRYFISITSATKLLLMTTLIKASGYRTYILNMNKPYNIYDLALKMIAHYTSDTSNEILIKEIGLRPGERMQESLFNLNESIQNTTFKHIKYVDSASINAEKITTVISKLLQVTRATSQKEIMDLIKSV